MKEYESDLQIEETQAQISKVMKQSVLLGFGPKQIKPFHTISNHVNVQVCAKLHIEISPPVTHVQFLSPGVAFCRFDKLGRSIIIRHIEPKPM